MITGVQATLDLHKIGDLGEEEDEPDDPQSDDDAAPPLLNERLRFSVAARLLRLLRKRLVTTPSRCATPRTAIWAMTRNMGRTL